MSFPSLSSVEVEQDHGFKTCKADIFSYYIMRNNILRYNGLSFIT